MNLLNITGAQEWHNKGYKGQGIKVMIADPLPEHTHDDKTAETIKFYAPDCDVFMYHYEKYKEKEMIDFAIKNGIDIINTSYGINYPDLMNFEERAKTAYNKAFDHGIIIVNSSGDEADLGISTSENGTIDTRVINVGAVERYLNIPNYSAYDDIGTVDCCGVIGLKMANGTTFGDTSEAAACVCGLITCAFSKKKLELLELTSFMAKNAIDLPENNKTGVGLFHLPSFANYLSVPMIKPDGTNIFVHKDFVYNAIIDKGYTY